MNKKTYMMVSLPVIVVLAVVIAFDWLQGMNVEPTESRETDVPIRVAYPNISNTAGDLTLTIINMTFTENHVMVLFHGTNNGSSHRIHPLDNGMIVQDGRILEPYVMGFSADFEWLSDIGGGESVTGYLVFERAEPDEMTVIVNLADEQAEHLVHVFHVRADTFDGFDTVHGPAPPPSSFPAT